MTHTEIVKEFRKIEKYLQSRARDIKKQYGEKPEFESEMDAWHFELLMQVCKTVKEEETELFGPLIKVDVPNMQFAHYGYSVVVEEEE